MTEDQLNYFRGLLPHEPRMDFMGNIRSLCCDDLGEEYLVFSSERVRQGPNQQDLMDNRTWGRKKWVAYCTCTCCNESFYTKKVPGVDAIEMYYGDDGCMYTIDPYDPGAFEVEPAGLGSIQIAEGDECNCPYCGSDVRPIHSKNLRGGRTKAVQLAQLLAVNGYAVIVYWLVQRHIDETGIDYCVAIPRDAFILADKGRILHFVKGRTDMHGNFHRADEWRLSKNTQDAWYKLYHDWGSINHKKRGSLLHPTIPSLVGTTGEKTGLYQYWKEGGRFPVEYLKAWKKRPALENLVNDGLAHLIDSLVVWTLENGYDMCFEFDRVLDLQKRKPHEILRVTKQEYKRIPKRDITKEILVALQRHRNCGFSDDADRVIRIWMSDNGNSLVKIQQQMEATGDSRMDRYLRYLEKQELRLRDIQMLVDARSFAIRLSENGAISQEELWPRHLRQFHDRLAEIISVEEDRLKANEYQLGFDRVLKQCGELEWTDGDLCIRLPRCNADLVREGKKLHHCVGGYGKSHSQGKHLIFFVRRYRRPERSYYTLNISMGPVPKRIQLHGYGNERHQDRNGNYRFHRVPEKVQAFCTRWEQDILMPYCKNNYRTEEST